MAVEEEEKSLCWDELGCRVWRGKELVVGDRSILFKINFHRIIISSLVPPSRYMELG